MGEAFWFLFGLVAFFSMFLTVAFRLEKRAVCTFGELESAPPFEDATGYAARWVREATESGFSFLGWARDSRSATYRLLYAMLVSPDRDIFAVVCVGTMLKIPFQATWLYTPASNGQTFCSTSNQSGVQIDLSGNWKNQLAPAWNFAGLLPRHQDWLRSLNVIPRPFTRGREFAEYRTLREGHFRHMERAGLIRFTDASCTFFYFTLTGAARTAISAYFIGIARRLSLGRFPRTA